LKRATSKEGAGKLICRASSVSTRMCETARLRNHFLFAGMTNHAVRRQELLDTVDVVVAPGPIGS
jgi:hypothetical protein